MHGLELVAESAGGRRNRVDTVLVRRLPADSADGAGRSVGAAEPTTSVSAEAESRQ